MSRQELTNFPPGFDPTLPILNVDEPHCNFYVHVRNFFDHLTELDFSKQNTLVHFNRGLTNAIRKDIYQISMQVREFRSKLAYVENAFESLHRTYELFDQFEHFLDNYSIGQLRWEGFQDHVEVVNEWADIYQAILNSALAPSDATYEWPLEQTAFLLVPKQDLGLVYKSIIIFTGPRIKFNRAMADKSLKNFYTALEVYEESIRHLQAQYTVLLGWLTSCPHWADITERFNKMHAESIREIKEEMKIYETEYTNLKALFELERTFVSREFDFQDTAEDSMHAVEAALYKYHLIVDSHKDILLMAVLNAYHHVLDLLKRISHLVSREIWPQSKECYEGQRSRYEREVRTWRLSIIHATQTLTDEHEVNIVLLELETIYKCVATFVLCYFKPY